LVGVGSKLHDNTVIKADNTKFADFLKRTLFKAFEKET